MIPYHIVNTCQIFGGIFSFTFIVKYCLKTPILKNVISSVYLLYVVVLLTTVLYFL